MHIYIMLRIYPGPKAQGAPLGLCLSRPPRIQRAPPGDFMSTGRCPRPTRIVEAEGPHRLRVGTGQGPQSNKDALS